jgi:hypothetical protein
MASSSRPRAGKHPGEQDGEPRILDFDWQSRSSRTEACRAGDDHQQFIGSLPWASPEQAEGRLETLIFVQMLFTGVILYHLPPGFTRWVN